MNDEEVIFLASRIMAQLQKYAKHLPAPVHEDYEVVVIVRYP